MQDLIDVMYMDKLDGRIGNEFFDAKAAEFRVAQCGLMRDIETHQNANQSYVEDGIRLLELAHQAAALFENQPPAEKRKLLDFVLPNCRWKDGQLEAEYRKPFACSVLVQRKDEGESLTEEGFRPSGGDFQGMRIYRSDVVSFVSGRREPHAARS
jgi:hypothetical protein